MRLLAKRAFEMDLACAYRSTEYVRVVAVFIFGEDLHDL